MRIRSLLFVSAAVLAGTLGLSPAAFAAERDPAHLIALTAHDPTQNGAQYPIKPGETIAVQAGVSNLGDKPVSGLVVHLWFIGGEERLTDNFSNCQYYLDGSEQGAWCVFDQELAAGGKYSLPPLHVSAPKDATEARTLVDIVYSKDYVDSQGGVAAVAKQNGTSADIKLVPGTGDKGSLAEGTDLTPSKTPGPISFIYFMLTLPTGTPTGKPTATATGTATATASATPATSATSAAPPAGQSGGSGGGLPVTGTNTAVAAGAGALLLVGGAAAFLLTRRRRAKFTA